MALLAPAILLITINNSTSPISNLTLTSTSIEVSGGPIPSLAASSTDFTTFTGSQILTQSDINNANMFAAFATLNFTNATGNTDGYYGGHIFPFNLPDRIFLHAFLDYNDNQMQDSGEPLTNAGKFQYQVNGGEMTEIHSPAYYLYETNPAKVYTLTYNIDPQYAGMYTATNTVYNGVTVPAGSNTTSYPFAVTAIPFTDLSINLSPHGAPPRPGYVYYNKIFIQNLGTMVIPAGEMTFTNSTTVTVTNVTPSGTITPTGFTCNFTNLLPNQTQELIVTMQVPTIPAVFLGQPLTNTVAASIPSGDIITENNAESLTQIIVGSYDPNDKTESHGPQILHSSFSEDDYLNYTIQFENTGTANAVNVRIEDLLDEKLDANTVTMISSSHPYSLERTGDLLTWRFNGIDLPPSVANSPIGKGYVTFKAKPDPGFAIGDVIENTANIYFDLNPAITTNTTVTEFISPLDVPDLQQTSIKLYPNPVRNILHVYSDVWNSIRNIMVMDLSGKVIFNKTVNSSHCEVDIASLASGIYFVKVTSNESVKIIKVVKD